MKNYVQHGDTIELTAPSGGVVAGVPVKIGGMVVVPQVSAAEGKRFNAKTSGVITFAKAASQAWVEGAVVCWDDSAKVFTTAATNNTKCGFAVEAVGNGASATLGVVKLVSVPA